MLENNTRTAPSKWSAERTALVADALRGSGNSRQDVRLRVHGESMLPTLWPGDIVEIERCSLEDLWPGEIVFAQREGSLFLHRLVGPCTPNGFVLRGDSMPAPDPRFPPEALLGRLAGATQRGPGATTAAWARTAGLLFCYCRAARRLALRLHHYRASGREFGPGTL